MSKRMNKKLIGTLAEKNMYGAVDELQKLSKKRYELIWCGDSRTEKIELVGPEGGVIISGHIPADICRAISVILSYLAVEQQ